MKSFKLDKQIAVHDGAAFMRKGGLAAFDTGYTDGLDKESGKKEFESIKEKLAIWQDKLYAQDQFSLLLVFQAMDAAGKDGTIKSVMTGVNPQGCQVYSFKRPTPLELDHDYLWRCYNQLPAKGNIGIFNRSYYEEVLVTRVHPEFILGQKIPGIKSVKDIGDAFWKQRYESIRNFEQHLSANGTVILKFFLNVSAEKQKERFLERISEPEKNWKFSYADLQERQHWDKYQQAYAEAIRHTASSHAPWHIIPSDRNWMRNLIVCSIVHDTLKTMGLKYPSIDDETRALLEKGKQELLSEK